ncbi:MAG: AAA family ATPase [Elusimicrobiales bacterium]|nr:AAA family ATPase [Elusimicrobiales bacterium]
MIKRLELEDFGKFRKTSLVFGPFTLVTGPNEAGKTTVFDALFDALCAGSKHEGRPLWKNMAARYGAIRRSSVVWEDGFAPLQFGDNEFLEIFAIRGGELSVKHPENKGASSWAEAAENALLNSGLNPARLAAGLRDKAESARKGSIQARLHRLKEAITDKGPMIAALRSERDAVLAGAQTAAGLAAERERRAAALELKNSELAQLGAKVEELSSAARLAAAIEGINTLRDLKEAREEAAALAAYASSELPAYRALKHTQSEMEKAEASAAAALAEKRSALDAAQKAAAELSAKAGQLQPRGEMALVLADKLAAFAAEPGKVTRVLNTRLRFGLWAGGLALAALVAYSGAGAVAYAAAAAILGAAGWAGFKLAFTQTMVPRGPGEEAAFLAGVAATWSTVCEAPLPKQGVEDARNYLARARADQEAAAEAAEAKVSEVEFLIASASSAEADLEDRARRARKAAAEADKWLKARACATEDEYQAKLAEYKARAARCADMEQRLAVFLRRNNCSAEKELKDKLHTEKESIERRGIGPEQANGPELERLKHAQALLAQEVRELEAALNKVASELETAKAVSGVRLGGLPERINLAETELEAEKAELAELELQAQACLLAAGVFDRLGESSLLAFEELGKEVSSVLQAVLPAASAEFRVFEAAGAAVTDATGLRRPVRNLSSGTRDLFMLAARLAIARRSRLGQAGPAPALLLLDEPFYTLDQARTRLALLLLAAFHKNTGWQIIILTKDPGVAAEAARLDGVKATEVALEPPKPL